MAKPPVNPRLLTPWPYTDAELQRIPYTLLADAADDVIESVILAASFFSATAGPRSQTLTTSYRKSCTHQRS